MRTTPTTTERGLGWRHQQQRDALLRRHVDGTPCPCQPGCGPACLCAGTAGLPMFKDRTRNPDGRVLQADHTLSRSVGKELGVDTQADRLLLATCNESRGRGMRSTAPAPNRDIVECEHHAACGSRHSRKW